MIPICDFHSHILPALDDGSRSMEESLAMLSLEAEQGISCVYATPHFYARQDNLDQFLQRREEAFRCLQSSIPAGSGLPELRLGAEVLFFPGMSRSDALQQLTMDAGPYILVEMPQAPWTDSMYRELEQISVCQGLTPIVAHVDRYLGRFRTYGIPGKLAQLPVLVQANASFFSSPRTCGQALKLLKQDQIQLLGSDCHNMSVRRPNLEDAVRQIRQKLGQEALLQIHRNSQTVLEARTPAL